ncbi:MAG: phosphodiester glycosidase family protein [Candidatus Melainabacteria bacterium]|jgi:hypothetical protein
MKLKDSEQLHLKTEKEQSQQKQKSYSLNFSIRSISLRNISLLISTLISALAYTPSSANITDVEQDAIMPGLIHHHFIKHTSRGAVIINALEIDMQKGFTVRPALAQENTIWAKATLPSIVAREGAYAGINANYFNSRGLPIGSLAIDSEWITGPVLNRASLSIDKNGKAYFARPSVTGHLQVFKGYSNNPFSASFPSNKPSQLALRLNSINQPDSLNQHGISFYNHWWQDSVTCGDGRTCVLVDGKGIVRLKVNSQEDKTSLYPTKTDYVLSALTNSSFTGINVGDKVTLTWYSKPDWSYTSHVIGGGPLLLSKGEIVLDESAEGFTAASGLGSSAPRTAVGITAVGRLIWVTADGRSKNSVGLSLNELAHLLKDIGVVEAMNLDGGGSTTMVLDGKIINSPSDSGGPRRVSNALLLYKPTSSY